MKTRKGGDKKKQSTAKMMMMMNLKIIYQLLNITFIVGPTVLTSKYKETEVYKKNPCYEETFLGTSASLIVRS